MADKPLGTRGLVESILELRGEAERRLMRNKYYVAIKKLDELLDAIRPLEAEVIEDDAHLRSPAALTNAGDRSLPKGNTGGENRSDLGDWAREPRRDPWERGGDYDAPSAAPAGDNGQHLQGQDEPLTLEESDEVPYRHDTDADMDEGEHRPASRQADFGH